VPLEDKEVDEKAEITLTCETSKPNVPVKWHKNGQEVVTGMRYKINQEGPSCALSIVNANLDDSAEYTCTIISNSNKTVSKLLVKGILIMIARGLGFTSLVLFYRAPD
jgi:hypothetical protein